MAPMSMPAAAPMSRIPRFNSSGNNFGHKRTISAPSKLEQLQADFQARWLKEKEERMVQVYQELEQRNVQNAAKYGKSSGYGSGNTGGSNRVRQFLQERRQGSGGKMNNWGMASKPPIPGFQKNSAGKDRGNPLAPINRGSAGSNSSAQSSHRGGAKGDESSVTGMLHSPKPPAQGKPRAMRARCRYFNTPSDSGNESSGFEDQNKTYIPHRQAKLYRKRQLNNNFPASSEEDVSKQSSFVKWKQQQEDARQTKLNTSSATTYPNGYTSDGPVNDFQKWQAKQDQERSERLRKHREQNNQENELDGTYTVSSKRKPSNTRSPVVHEQDSLPSVRRQESQRTPKTVKKLALRRNIQYEDSDVDDTTTSARESARPSARESSRSTKSNTSKVSAMERSKHLEAELKKKEQDLLKMIQAQKEELESLKKQRQDEEEEEHRRSQAQQERERKVREGQEQQQKFEIQKEQENLNTQRSQSRSRPTPVKPSPSPVIPTKPKVVKPKPKKVQKNPLPPPPDDEESFYGKSSTANYYEEIITGDPDAKPVELNRTACPNCGRKFATDRLSKHTKACKTAAKAAANRKVFDTTKMRTEGTEMSQYTNDPKKGQPEKKRNNGDWRKKHEDFIKALRYAKKATAIENQGGDPTKELGPPPRTDNSHYEPCPYCNRTFAPETAKRHIPSCKERILHGNPPKTLRSKRR